MKTFFAHSLAVVLLAAVLPAQFFEARSAGMGGASVAAANYLAAPLANPALLARFREQDSFGMLLPSIGVLVADEDELAESIDDLQDSIDTLEQALDASSATPAQVNDVITRLNALDGKTATAAAGLNFVFAFPSDAISVAIVGRSYLDASVTPTVAAGDTAIIAGATSSADLDNLQTEARLIGAAVSDLGISLAKRFDLGAAALSIGVTPKYQRVDTYNYAVNVDNFDENDFDDERFRADDSGFNADIGAAVQFGEMLTVGAMLRNVTEENYETVLTNGQRFTYTVEPQLTIGAALTLGALTLAADVDVTEIERFELRSDESRFVRAGLELNGWDWIQLRVGGRFDTSDTVEDIVTAGIGLSPFDVFHLDVAGMIGEDNTYGAVVQMAFTF